MLVICMISISHHALADRTLSPREIKKILQQMTSNPTSEGWISSGAIEAQHQIYEAPKVTDAQEILSTTEQRVAAYRANPGPEVSQDLQQQRLAAIPFNTRYKLSNEMTQQSTETVIYDGQHFRWEIRIDARTDSIQPGPELQNNNRTNEFKMEHNTNRIMAWDGQQYTLYCPQVHHALVDRVGRLPRAVNGPLTAGYIPWGKGYFSYQNLQSMTAKGLQKESNGNQSDIDLTLVQDDGRQIALILDPEKDHAVLSYTYKNNKGRETRIQYADYQLIHGKWIPNNIIIEEYESASQRLLKRDEWTFAIDTNTPNQNAFRIDYPSDTTIEAFSPAGQRTVITKVVQNNTEAFLNEKLDYDAGQGSKTQNCATASLQYACRQLGISLTQTQLDALVNPSTGQTSLYAMKQLAQDKGLRSQAVHTDLETLESLKDCQIILYIPGKKHFTVLESMDNAFAYVLDLASHRFYYRVARDDFDQEWPGGIALILSHQEIRDSLNRLQDEKCKEIVGATGYDCTDQIQSYYEEFCNAECTNERLIVLDRRRCAYAESGTCSEDWLCSIIYCPCTVNLQNPDECTLIRTWTLIYLMACA